MDSGGVILLSHSLSPISDMQFGFNFMQFGFSYASWFLSLMSRGRSKFGGAVLFCWFQQVAVADGDAINGKGGDC